VELVGLTWEPLFNEPAQTIVIPAKVSAAFEALIDRGNSKLAALGTAVLDMIGRTRQHFGHRAAPMRTDLGSKIVLLHVVLMPARAFHDRFRAMT
jgi:hypothetical protein